MILVIGGYASGKCVWARSRGFGEPVEAVSFAEALRGYADGSGKECPWEGAALLHVHELAHDQELSHNVDQLAEALSKAGLVTTTEVGCGIVPLDAQQRAWRERAGRLNEALAARADTVVRMVCGIPTVLKGEGAPDGGKRG